MRADFAVSSGGRGSSADAGDQSGEPVGDLAGHDLRRCLDHHPHQRLGARGAQQHPARAAELGLGGGDRRRRPPSTPPTAALSATGTLISTCGSRVITAASSAERASGARHRAPSGAARSAGRRRWWRAPGGRRARTARRRARNRRRAAPPARSGRRPRSSQRDAGVGHGEVQAEVAHHGGDERCPAASSPRVAHGEREDRQDLVAVDDGRRRRDREAAVGVAVVGDAQVGAVLDRPRRRSDVQVGGADAVVDVQPVGLGVDGDDLGAGRGGTPRARASDAAPCAQSTTTCSPSSGCRRGRQQVVDVALERRRRRRATRPMPRPVGTRPRRRRMARPRSRPRARRAACARRRRRS